MTQLTLDAAKGEALKREGLELVESHNHRWVDRMRQYAMEISEKSGHVTMDNLRVYAEQLGLHPKNSYAWGSVFHGVKWKHVGWQRSALPSNKGRHIQVWQWIP